MTPAVGAPGLMRGLARTHRTQDPRGKIRERATNNQHDYHGLRHARLPVLLGYKAVRTGYAPNPRARPPACTNQAAAYASTNMYPNWIAAHCQPMRPPPASRTVMAVVLMHMSAYT